MCNCLSVVPCGLMEMLRKNLSQNTAKQFRRDAYEKNNSRTIRADSICKNFRRKIIIKLIKHEKLLNNLDITILCLLYD